MQKNKMTDTEIIVLIREGKTTKAFEAIYGNFPVIRKMILSLGGTVDDARDIFQDSIIVFYRISSKQDFILSSSISTLLYSISKKLWFKKIRDVKSKEVKFIEAKEMEDEINNSHEEEIEENEKIKLVEKILQELGEPCRNLLEKFYYEKYSMKEIAESLGYSNEKTAKAQKYKCIERGKKLLGEKILLFKTLFQ